VAITAEGRGSDAGRNAEKRLDRVKSGTSAQRGLSLSLENEMW
jgi:hypothetical protein